MGMLPGFLPYGVYCCIIMQSGKVMHIRQGVLVNAPDSALCNLCMPTHAMGGVYTLMTWEVVELCLGLATSSVVTVAAVPHKTD